MNSAYLKRYEIKCHCQEEGIPFQERIYCEEGRNVAAIDVESLIQTNVAQKTSIENLQSEIAILRELKDRPAQCQICDEGKPTVYFGALTGPSYVVCTPCARLYAIDEIRTRLDLKSARKKIDELKLAQYKEEVSARAWRKRAADLGDLAARAEIFIGEEVSPP